MSEKPQHINIRSDYDSLKEDIEKSDQNQERDRAEIWAEFERVNKHFEATDARISSLEKWQWFCYGLAAAVGAVATWVLRGLGLKE